MAKRSCGRKGGVQIRHHDPAVPDSLAGEQIREVWVRTLVTQFKQMGRPGPAPTAPSPRKECPGHD